MSLAAVYESGALVALAAAHEGGKRKGAVEGAFGGCGGAATAGAASDTKPDAISAEATAARVSGANPEGCDLE